DRLRAIYVELEFNNLAKALTRSAPEPAPDAPPVQSGPPARYETVDSADRLDAVVAAARAAPFIAVHMEVVPEAGAPEGVLDPLRAELIGMTIAVAPGEAFYLPFAHRDRRLAQPELSLLDDAAPVEEPKKKPAK